MIPENKQKSIYNPWKILFYIFPSILIFRSSEYLIENYIGQILMSGILAGLGAFLGAITYKIVENKSTMIKVIGFVVSTVLCILYLYLITKNFKVNDQVHLEFLS